MKKILIFIFILFLSFCGEYESTYTIPQLGNGDINYDYYSGDMPDWYGQIVRVADGDTFYVNFYSEEKMGVRIFGVDTPETVDKRKDVQYWGPEASEFSKQYLYPGIKVMLNFDGEITGPFGRLLAEPWILVDGEWINYSRILLETGNAFVYGNYYFPIYKLYEYLEYQQYAIDNSYGMWANSELIENEIVITIEDVFDKYSWFRREIKEYDYSLYLEFKG